MGQLVVLDVTPLRRSADELVQAEQEGSVLNRKWGEPSANEQSANLFFVEVVAVVTNFVSVDHVQPVREQLEQRLGRARRRREQDQAGRTQDPARLTHVQRGVVEVLEHGQRQNDVDTGGRNFERVAQVSLDQRNRRWRAAVEDEVDGDTVADATAAEEVAQQPIVVSTAEVGGLLGEGRETAQDAPRTQPEDELVER